MINPSFDRSWLQFAVAGMILVAELLVISTFFRHTDSAGIAVMIASTLTYIVFVSSRGQSASGAFDYKLALINLVLIIACFWGGAFMEPPSKAFADTLLYLLAGTYLSISSRNRRSFSRIVTGLFAPQLIFWLPALLFFSDAEFKLLPILPWLSLPFIYWIGHSKRKLVPAVVSTVVLIFGLYTSYATYLAALSGTTYSVTSKPQPDYRANLGLIDREGRKFRVAELRNKIVVLDMWYTGCGYCYAGFPKFQQLASKYSADSNILFASLNLPLDSEVGTLKAFDLIANYQFRQFVSEDPLGSDKWGVKAFPMILVFDKAQQLRYIGRNNTEHTELVNNVPDLIEKLVRE